MTEKSKITAFSLAVRFAACALVASILTYSYIDKQNRLTEMRRSIPKLYREVQEIHELNRKYQYDIDRFENPLHLLELKKKPEYSHLRYPTLDEVIVIDDVPEGRE